MSGALDLRAGIGLLAGIAVLTAPPGVGLADGGALLLLGAPSEHLGGSRVPEVIDAASEVLIKLFGHAGHHARSAIGVAELPRNAPVEIEFAVMVLNADAARQAAERDHDPGDELGARLERGIVSLPETLGEAIDELSRSELARKALGPHIFDRYVELKRKEWDEYRVQLTEWELEKYLSTL